MSERPTPASITIDAWFRDLIPQIMASGALHAFENPGQFRGSQRALSDHFIDAAESFMKYRGEYEVDDLIERLAGRES